MSTGLRHLHQFLCLSSTQVCACSSTLHLCQSRQTITLRSCLQPKYQSYCLLWSSILSCLYNFCSGIYSIRPMMRLYIPSIRAQSDYVVNLYPCLLFLSAAPSHICLSIQRLFRFTADKSTKTICVKKNCSSYINLGPANLLFKKNSYQISYNQFHYFSVNFV